jgi:SAM-dependent methyltransferase
VTDVWTSRAEAYRASEAHREGADLELFATWVAGCRTALDVATGGGHTARRLREAGLEVVTSDPAPGMRADVLCPAEHLPFADRAFEVVVTRVAPHHFADVGAAVEEMARVSSRLVLVSDNLFVSEAGEEADRLRDPTHVRNSTEEEWRGFFGQAGLRIAEAVRLVHEVQFEPWLERTGCAGEEAERVRELLADRVTGGRLALPRIVLRGEV